MLANLFNLEYCDIERSINEVIEIHDRENMKL